MKKIHKFSSPVHVSINTTAKCNLNCTHCSGDYGLKKESEMNWSDWERVVDYLKYANVYTVNLTGGEPTQFPYLFNMLELLRANNIFVTLSTNLIFGKNVLEKIQNYKDIIRNIKTSVDGFDSETNGIIRKTYLENEDKIFDEWLNNYKELKKRGFNITVTTVLHKRILMDFSKMIDFILDIKPNNWVVSPIVSVGRAKYNASKIIPEYDMLMSPNYEAIKNILNKHQIMFSQVDFPSIKNIDPYGCPACNESVIVNYDGTIAPCQLALEILPRFGYDFPNILHTDFDDIWNCDSFSRFRYNQSQGCFDCSINDKCKRCIPQSLQYFDDVKAPTPYCISVADYIGLKNKEYWKNKLHTINLEKL